MKFGRGGDGLQTLDLIKLTTQQLTLKDFQLATDKKAKWFQWVEMVNFDLSSEINHYKINIDTELIFFFPDT